MDALVNAYCEHCGHGWPAMSEEVHYSHDYGIFECTDEVACFERRAIQQTTEPERAAMWRALERVWEQLRQEGWRI